MADEKKITIEECLQYLFQCRDQVHLWHFQTKSYAEHKTLAKLYVQILDSTDKIIETWQGCSGTRVVGMLPIKTAPYTNTTQIIKYLGQVKEWLLRLRAETLYKELPNLIDSLIADLSQAQYLLTLN